MQHVRLQNQTKLIRLPKVSELTGMARSTIYERMKNGAFPRPLKLSVRHVAWREEDVFSWIESLPMSEGVTWDRMDPGPKQCDESQTAHKSK